MRVVAVMLLFWLAGCTSEPPVAPDPVHTAPPEEPALPPVAGEPGTVPEDPAYRVESSEHPLYIECQVSIVGLGPYCNTYDDYTARVTVPDGALVAHFEWSTNYTDGLQTFLALDMQNGEVQGGYYKNFDPTHELVLDSENVTTVRVGVRARDMAVTEQFATGIALDAYGHVKVTFYLDGVPEGLDPMCIPCIIEP